LAKEWPNKAMEEGVVRSRFGHFRSFLEVLCVVVFVTHVRVPFFDKSHFLIPVASSGVSKFSGDLFPHCQKLPHHKSEQF